MAQGQKKKKKFSSGIATRYISRKKALRKLQLPLRSFTTLCILKGIYPREPENRKKAQKNAPGVKVMYSLKDIQFLMHEPLLLKIREQKVAMRKLTTAKRKKDTQTFNRLMTNFPKLKVDHLIKERFPTFMDALRDLDDCLTLCFMYSQMANTKYVYETRPRFCRRLTMEFMHYVIQARALRKAFISFKGYYYQAEIKGQLVNWIMPHPYPVFKPTRVTIDMRLMSTFTDFYVTMLGFVNYHLYHSQNLYYPPKLTVVKGPEYEDGMASGDMRDAERIAALNIPVKQIAVQTEDETKLDEFEPQGTNEEELEKRRKEYAEIQKLKKLFEGLKFFLNREVPREHLVFMIKCFGGEVSWDKLHFVGATFQEDDETITHQIVDRPEMKTQYLSRFYVQPQWVFDSVNARRLLPVDKYLMGCVLPPHLSPFGDPTHTEKYIPPEEYMMNEMTDGDPTGNDEVEQQDGGDEPEDISDISESSDDNESDEDANDVNPPEDQEEQQKEEEEEDPQKKLMKTMAVTQGTVEPHRRHAKQRALLQEKRLLVKMVQKKHRFLFKTLMRSRHKRNKEVKLLKRKRKEFERQQVDEDKLRKKIEMSK